LQANQLPVMHHHQEAQRHTDVSREN